MHSLSPYLTAAPGQLGSSVHRTYSPPNRFQGNAVKIRMRVNRGPSLLDAFTYRTSLMISPGNRSAVLLLNISSSGQEAEWLLGLTGQSSIWSPLGLPDSPTECLRDPSPKSDSVRVPSATTARCHGEGDLTASRSLQTGGEGQTCRHSAVQSSSLRTSKEVHCLGQTQVEGLLLVLTGLACCPSAGLLFPD